MKMVLIAIFDRKAQSFIEMSATPSIGVAARQFTEAVNKQSESPIYKWPEDFELYEIGEWDTETGRPFPRENEACDYDKKLIVAGDTVKIR